MAGVSDGLSLLLKFKADSSQAKSEISDFRKTVKSELDAIEGNSKNTFTDFAQSLGLSAEKTAALSTALPIAGAAIAGIAAAASTAAVGLFSLAASAAEYGDSIGDASDKTGLSIQTLSALKFQANVSGQSFEALEGAVLKFSRQIVQAEQGSDKAAESLQRLGIASPKKALEDLDGTLATVIKNILQLPAAQQGAAAMAAFGKAGGELLPFLHDFNGNLPELIARAKQLGAVLSDEDAKNAGEFEKSLGTLKAQATALAVQFGNQFVPQLTDGMKEVSKFFTENQETVRGWGQAVGKYLSDTLTEIKSQGGGWEEAGGILARRFVDGFGSIVFKGITGAVDEAARQTKEYFKSKDGFLNFFSENGGAVGGLIGSIYRPETFTFDPSKLALPPNIDDVVLKPVVKPTFDTSEFTKDLSKPKKEVKDSFDKQFRGIAEEFGFQVSRTVGKAVNKGSLHPLGLAGDLAVKGKTDLESFNVIAAFLEKGFRVIDERVVGAFKGITSTGPNIHAEHGAGTKDSLFLDASRYGGQNNLDYLKKLDADRRNKKTSVDDAEELAKKRVEDDKAANEKLVKQNDEASARILDRAKQAADEEQALNEQLLAKNKSLRMNSTSAAKMPPSNF